MEADHFYLIRGSSGANSPFFENESDCKLFMEYADRFLRDYVSITSFQNNRDGWVMLVRTKSAKTIKRAYFTRRAKSNKCKKEFELSEVWQMLSDQFRIFLSAYVKATNYRSGRKGAKVRARFERYYFESEEEAQTMREVLENDYYVQAQPMKRYRPSKKLHKLRKRLLRTSTYMSSRLLRLKGRAVELCLKWVDVGFLDSDVARQIIKRTFSHHQAAIPAR